MTEEEVKNESSFSVNINLTNDDIKSIIDECVDEDEEDDELYIISESDLKRRLFVSSIVKLMFFFSFLASVFIFPYEIMTDHTFGLGKAFLLVFWGLTCFVFGSGVAKVQNKIRRRLREVRGAAAPKAS
jgi:hypothetical protein